MGLQINGTADFLAQYHAEGDLYTLIISMIENLPFAPFVLALLFVTMIAFYATSFDSIALTASCYSYYKLEEGESPHKLVQLLWCILLILLPIALVFSESSMSNLQSVSIIAAFPVGGIMIIIILGFIKDAEKYLSENKGKSDK